MTKPEAERPLELSLTRVLGAPRALVWSVWTEPEHAKQWWGPHGFTTPVYEADLRPGGSLRVHMRAPDGEIFPQEGIFEIVDPPQRLVTVGAVEIAGSVAFEARTEIRLTESDGKTTVRVLQTYSNLSPAAAGAIEGAPIGWSQQFEKLDTYLRMAIGP
jgi:uncharacterized protein YndB with AHSA1/START domain